MRFAFRATIVILLCLWGRQAVHAQDDLVAKAQSERELVVYGTALAGQFDKFIEPFKRRYPFIKPMYSRTTGEALTTKILQEVSARQLSADAILINNYTQRIFMKRNIITAVPAAHRQEFPGRLRRPTGLLVWFLPGALRDHLQHLPGFQGQRAEIFR